MWTEEITELKFCAIYTLSNLLIQKRYIYSEGIMKTEL